MFKGNYNFFDYKYNIVGYEGQDFGSVVQYFYLVFSIVLLITILIVLKNSKKETTLKILKITTIVMIALYIIKTTWETIYDISYSGSFNRYLLPFDACSIIMLAGLLASFAKGKIKDYALSWIGVGSIVGGLSNMLFLNALKYYPFFTFGAFYSMLWHLLMVFLGLLLIVTNTIDYNYKVLLKAYAFHMIFSLVVIPIDYIFKLDFMMYKDLGSIPIFENIGAKLTQNNLGLLNPLLMAVLYFLAFNLIFIVIKLTTIIINKINNYK